MIIGFLSHIEQEMRLYPAALQQGLRFLMENDIAALNTGKQEIQGSTMYAMISDYETQPKEERRPEAHQKYIDIQYLAAGEEMIGCGPLEASLVVDEDFLKEKDVIFYQGLTAETETVLQPGMFAIYFPWDVHRPNCAVGNQPCRVRKVVVKVAVDAVCQP